MTIKEDILIQSNWIVEAFASDGFQLDYTIDSFIELDRFFNENMKGNQSKAGGRLDRKEVGNILFGIGSYVGETIIRQVSGAAWIKDENDGGTDAIPALKLPDGMEIWPVQRIIKRYQNGFEDAVYPYAYSFLKDILSLSFNERFWQVAPKEDKVEKKPWWKIW